MRQNYLVSLPMRGEWIEIFIIRAKIEEGEESLPMRGEWIEILGFFGIPFSSLVSPHAGRVD